MLPLTQFKRFDVRDLIRRGVEPFPEILKRVTALKPEEGLIVVAPTAARMSRIDLRTASRNAWLAFSIRCQRSAT